MISIVQYHLPSTQKEYPFLAIGKNHDYQMPIDKKRFAALTKDLKNVLAKKRKVGLVLSGSFIEHLQQNNAAVVEEIKEALAHQQVELLGTTYYFSLASLYSPALFKVQIKMHQVLVKNVFGVTPVVFYNTCGIYFDKLSAIYQKLGYTAAIVPISSWHLNGRSPDIAYSSKGNNVKLLLVSDQAIVDVERQFPVISLKTNLKFVLPTDALIKPTDEIYFVPQPIYNKEFVVSGTLSSNALQHAIHKKIISLKKKIKKSKRLELLTPLSAFTSLDYFESMTKPDDQNDTTPYKNYESLMNILTDFELVNAL